MKIRSTVALSVVIISVSSVPTSAATKPSVVAVAQGSGQTPQERMDSINNSRIDGIKVQSATRVEAGKYFQVKLISNKRKVNGVCWLDWALSKGFAIPREFKMTGGKASVKLLPIEPGAGEMSFKCGAIRGDEAIGGSSTIYIAP